MNEMLRDLMLVFLVAGAVLLLFHRLRFPTVVGLLFAGFLMGPHAFGILRDGRQIQRADVRFS